MSASRNLYANRFAVIFCTWQRKRSRFKGQSSRPTNNNDTEHLLRRKIKKELKEQQQQQLQRQQQQQQHQKHRGQCMQVESGQCGYCDQCEKRMESCQAKFRSNKLQVNCYHCMSQPFDYASCAAAKKTLATKKCQNQGEEKKQVDDDHSKCSTIDASKKFKQINSRKFPTKLSSSKVSNQHDTTETRRILTSSTTLMIPRLSSAAAAAAAAAASKAINTVYVILLAINLTCSVSYESSSNLALQSDPRPTIYSGQVSFGLLLSAHSTPGVELAAAAATIDSEYLTEPTTITTTSLMMTSPTTLTTTTMPTSDDATILPNVNTTTTIRKPLANIHDGSSAHHVHYRTRRQIFERSHHNARRQQQAAAASAAAQSKQAATASSCSQVQPNSLYAGMGAIWASHQANLVGDSALGIGTYVYDSCNDLDVGQRQAVRIVANLNAFQQTTCEAPRGSPISLTIAHGDNQLRAIQLLTSFRVPVITTREHFALEDYSLLSREQKKFLFSTSPSSRHLAAGSLRFAKRVVSRSVSSPKLPNQFHKMSSKNGLIVISRNLPARFISHLSEVIPNHVNYELVQTSSPIDQLKSIDALESILSPSSSSSSTSSKSGSSLITNESQQVATLIRKLNQSRKRRQTGDSDSGDGTDSGGGDSSSSGNHRVLSPTILMFITTDEAIDLVTRLRNDLADVSRYYSLIVSTREDISPALRTIFHRGGSRLCSGKAFYTISPKPDDIGEFARYFRDTVQMEAEASDHPLVTEYAKYQSQNKQSSNFDSDLDDISTEAVIKAVWSAAAAFKLVHKRECGSLIAAANLAAQSTEAASAANARQQGRRQSQAAAAAAAAAANNAAANAANNRAAHQECMAKMNKNMSNMVQRTLKRLDVTINSTGLQALDGFRIKFDEFNELMTNKFTIKYINKECEITEIGQFSGFKDSSLRLDDDLMIKSLESTLPDPWPVTTPAPTAATPTSTTNTATNSSPTSTNALSSDDSSSSSNDGATGNSDSSDSPSTGSSTSGGGNDEDSKETPKRRRSESALSSAVLTPSGKPIQISSAQDKQKQRNRNNPAPPNPGGFQSDVSPVGDQIEAQDDQRQGRSTNGSVLPDQIATSRSPSTVGSNNMQMRPLKQFNAQNKHGQALREWLPKEKSSDDDQMLAKSTTQAPQFSIGPMMTSTPLPESGGNTDLDEPPSVRTRTTSSSATTPSSTGSKHLDTASSSTTETTTLASNDFVKMPSISNLATAPVIADLNGSPIRQYLSAGRRAAIPFDSSAAIAEHNRYLSMHGYSDQLSHFRDLRVTPVPLSTHHTHDRMRLDPQGQIVSNGSSIEQATNKQHEVLWKLRSHLRWISSSWFAMVILGANICGALLTLYVLTFLLMKNCDGSLDRENQSVRSMHLLAIIVVFFGSTLFIVYPTPGLCLLRSSWHNIALVLIFGSLLLQTMQARSMHSIGLGGRPNRVNQFLTLMFMVGVQISFELQRWKYESINYFNFVQQHFGQAANSQQSSLNSADDNEKRLLRLNSAITMSHLNPLSSLDDQVTPVSLQLSEKYQMLLHEYCTQPLEDFLQSQFYLWLIIAILILFSLINRSRNNLSGFSSKVAKSNGTVPSTLPKSKQGKKHRSRSTKPMHINAPANKQYLISGKLLATQHETNNFTDPINLNNDNFENHQEFKEFARAPMQFSPTGTSAANITHMTTIGNVFVVTLICAPIYFLSIVLYVHGQNWISNHDLVSSITMVSIAFTTLIGIFLPVLRNVRQGNYQKSHNFALNHNSSSGNLLNDLQLHGSNDLNNGGLITAVQINAKQNGNFGKHHRVSASSSDTSAQSNAFAMFPEFASIGLRRPASLGGDSNSGLIVGGSNGGHKSRAPFAPAKESRKNMSAALANLGPGATDSMRRALGVHQRQLGVTENRRRSTGINGDPIHLDHNDLALDLGQHPSINHCAKEDCCPNQQQAYPKQLSISRQSMACSSGTGSAVRSGEKRLIMLDVDPCCPRHGVGSNWAPRSGLITEN